jgi:hypothetical protein
MNTDPRRTLDLLDALHLLGFNEQAFALLHHRHGTIVAHRQYCENVTHFVENLNNARVQRRLEIVLDAYRGGGFTSGSPDVFSRLADASVVEVPFVAGTDE